MKKFLALFDFEGTIGAFQYGTIGITAMLIKYVCDARVAAWLEHETWTPWNYISPFETSVRLITMGNSHRQFLFAMSLVALPFVWLGLSLTVKRMRSVGFPLSYVLIFFLPFANLLMFLLLCLLPPGSRTKTASEGAGNSGGAFAVWTSAAICTVAVFLAGSYAKYGWALFVGTPFCLGLLTTVLYTRKDAKTLSACLKISLAACVAASAALLCFAFEGLICILMAAPIIVPLALLGGWLGYYVQPNRMASSPAIAMILLLAVFPPAMIRTESKLTHVADEFSVTSSVEVNAPPEVVWRNVITFSQLQGPKELLFKSGIAYPIRAEIEGRGVGAVRYCMFSTGPFVEPITVWDEPHVLEFSVKQVPAPMNELSPYPGLHPPHLDGYFVSRKGHFVLTALPGGRTRLDGTTWYSHNLWPEAYWTVWSDYVIHRIHLRVLNHVKQLSEADGSLHK